MMLSIYTKILDLSNMLNNKISYNKKYPFILFFSCYYIHRLWESTEIVYIYKII